MTYTINLLNELSSVNEYLEVKLEHQGRYEPLSTIKISQIGKRQHQNQSQNQNLHIGENLREGKAR